MSYQELSIEERITIQFRQLQDLSQRAIAQMLDRCPSTNSRELRRNAANASPHPASQAQYQKRLRRTPCRPAPEFEPDLFDLVAYLLLKRFSP